MRNSPEMRVGLETVGEASEAGWEIKQLALGFRSLATRPGVGSLPVKEEGGMPWTWPGTSQALPTFGCKTPLPEGSLITGLPILGRRPPVARKPDKARAIKTADVWSVGKASEGRRHISPTAACSVSGWMELQRGTGLSGRDSSSSSNSRHNRLSADHLEEFGWMNP